MQSTVMLPTMNHDKSLNTNDASRSGADGAGTESRSDSPSQPNDGPSMYHGPNQLKEALQSLEKTLDTLEQNHSGQPPALTMAQLIGSVDKAGPTIAASLLTIPFLQPVPLFGLSAPAGFTIGLSGVALMLGKPIWLPKQIANLRIGAETVRKTVKLLLEFEAKLKPYINNGSLTKLRIAPQDSLRRLLGIWIAIHGVLLALPLPIPFSNALPAWACLFASLTVLFGSRRLFFVTSAMVIVNVIFWVGLVVATVWGIPTLMQFFQE